MAHENRDLAEEIDESVEVAEGHETCSRKSKFSERFCWKGWCFGQGDRKNSERAQENQDLAEEINESVEITKEKDQLVLKKI